MKFPETIFVIVIDIYVVYLLTLLSLPDSVAKRSLVHGLCRAAPIAWGIDHVIHQRKLRGNMSKTHSDSTQQIPLARPLTLLARRAVDRQ